jgi:hypothetical protein
MKGSKLVTHKTLCADFSLFKFNDTMTIPMGSIYFNLLKPSGNFTYDQV